MPKVKKPRFSLKYRVQAVSARVWLWFFHLKRKFSKPEAVHG